MLHSLEQRRFLNATLDVSGLLTVAGSDASDIITISRSGASLVVNVQPANTNQSFPLSSVTGLLVNGEAGNDFLTIDDGIAINATAVGGAGDDTLITGGGEDLLLGGDGDDQLDGRSNADAMIGEGGFDTVDYRSRTGNITVRMDDHNNDGAAAELDYVDPTVDMILGGSGDDLIVSDDSADVRVFYGNAGNDTLIGAGGADRLNGGPGDDSLTGWGGDDLFVGGAGRDIFNGGDGIDTVSYYYTNQRLVVSLDDFGNDGARRERDNVKSDVENIVGGDGDDVLQGSAARNVIDGGGGDDWIEGLNGNDLLVGSDGKDTLHGGQGNDVLRGGAGADWFIGGSGDGDLVDYSDRSQALSLSIDGIANDGAINENDFIGNDVEHLAGGSGNDLLIGSAASNRLDGGPGADTLHAGGGQDILIGGAGRDTLFAKPDDQIVAADDGELDEILDALDPRHVSAGRR